MGAAPDPIALFGEMYARALAVDRSLLPEPDAMTVATVAEDGAPSARVVLLKGVDERGFVFYTNVESRKGRELSARPRAALCFYWSALDLQIRAEGKASRVSEAEADEYFASRPRGSQIAAWASKQSSTLQSADELDARVARYEKEFGGAAVPRPPFWSGFRIEPERIEFWKNRPDRLHDRKLYTRTANGWKIESLYP